MSPSLNSKREDSHLNKQISLVHPGSLNMSSKILLFQHGKSLTYNLILKMHEEKEVLYISPKLYFQQSH